MNITYEEYMSSIPKMTKIKVKNILKLMYAYDQQGEKIKIDGKLIKKTNNIIGLASVVEGIYAQFDMHLDLFSTEFYDTMREFRYNSILEGISLTLEDEKLIFEKYKKYFLQFQDKVRYRTQGVYDILINAISMSDQNTLNKIQISSEYIQFVKTKRKKERKKETENLDYELCDSLSETSYNFLKLASRIRESYLLDLKYELIQENEFIKNNDECLVPLSLFLAILEDQSEESKIIREHLEKNGIYKSDIQNLIPMPSILNAANIRKLPFSYRIPYSKKIKSLKERTYYESIAYLYKDYYKENSIGGNTILTDIVNNLFNGNMMQNNIIEKILDKEGISTSAFSTFIEDVEKNPILKKIRRTYLKDKLISDGSIIKKNIVSLDEHADINKDDIVEEYEKKFASLNSKLRIIFTDATKIIKALQNKNNKLFESLSTENQSSLALFLSLLKNYNSKNCITKFNISYETILELFGCEQLLLEDEIDYDYLKNYILDFCKNGKNKQVNEEEVCIKVFESPIIKNIIENMNVDFEIFKNEFTYQKDYLDTINLSEKVQLLKESSIPKLDFYNTANIILFGSELEEHLQYINSEYLKILSNSKEMLNTDSIQNTIMQIKEEIKSKEANWFHKFIKPVDNQEDTLNLEKLLTKLNNKISKKINPLCDNIESLEKLIEYMREYSVKNKEHLIIINEVIEKVKLEKEQNTANEIMDRMKYNTCINALESKKENMEITDKIINNYIYSIYTMIQSDLTTVNGFLIAKNTLIPLIEKGILISQDPRGNKSSNLNKFVISLLGNVISKNNEGLEQNLKDLELLDISDEELTKLSNDVNGYINQLASSKNIELPIIEEQSNSKEKIKRKIL